MTAVTGRTRPATRLAAAFGCTEGQVYTLVLGATFAVVFALAGIPPALQGKRLLSAGPPAAAAAANPGYRTALPVPRRSGPSGSGGVGAAAMPAGADSFTAGYPVAGGPGSPSGGLAASPGGAPGAPPTGTDSPAPATGTPSGTPVELTVFQSIGSPGAPYGVAVGPDGTVYVGTDNGASHGVPGPSHIFAFDPTGRRTGDYTVEGQPAGHADGLAGLAVGPTGRVVAADPDSGRVLTVDPAKGTVGPLLDIPDLSPCAAAVLGGPCEPGAVDHKPSPTALAYAPDGDLYIADAAQATVWRYPAGSQSASPQVWYQSVAFTSGPVAGGPDGPAGLVFASGSVEVSVGTALDPANPGAGGLYRIPVEPGGQAGAATLDLKFARGDRPGAIAVTSDGTLYVVLRGPDSIARFPRGATSASPFDPPDHTSVPVDGLSGLAVGPSGLLATNLSLSNQPAHWAVFLSGLG